MRGCERRRSRPSPMADRWHVVYTAIAAEAVADAAIAALGYETFTPFEKRIRRLPGRKPRPYQTAYFPRYGFAKFDADQNEWPNIFNAKGVCDIIQNNCKPLSVVDQVIDALKVADAVGMFDRTKPPSVGMQIEVTCGPFSGFLGKIIRARTADRVDVALKMFGADVSTTVPLMALREMAK